MVHGENETLFCTDFDCFQVDPGASDFNKLDPSQVCYYFVNIIII